VGRSGRRVLCAVIVVTWCLGAHVRAQVGGGTLAGLVADASGASLPGATVTATETATTLTRMAVTASDGGYSIPGLRPGLYVVRIELAGFRRVVHENPIRGPGYRTLDIAVVRRRPAGHPAGAEGLSRGRRECNATGRLTERLAQ
jgi:hypothetical protein